MESERQVATTLWAYMSARCGTAVESASGPPPSSFDDDGTLRSEKVQLKTSHLVDLQIDDWFGFCSLVGFPQ